VSTRARKTRERVINVTALVLRISPRSGSISSESVSRVGNENFTSEFFRIRSPLRFTNLGAGGTESGIRDNSNATLRHPALISDGTLVFFTRPLYQDCHPAFFEKGDLPSSIPFFF